MPEKKGVTEAQKAIEEGIIVEAENDNVVQIEGLKMHFPILRGVFRRQVGSVKAVDGVELAIGPGETVGLVGESGCGKTTLARCLVRAYKPTAGRILFNPDGTVVDLAAAEGDVMRDTRKRMQLIFQDPYGSLNPRMTIGEIVGEPLIIDGMPKGREMNERVNGLLKSVGLSPIYAKRFPHAFSGGQRQRIGIARAMALNPRLILADEPTSSLDVSVQAQILNLLEDLQDEHKLSYLFISHDLSMVRHISDRVYVMYVGNIVETAETDALFATPEHPYTEALLSAVPHADPHYEKKRILLAGDVADPANLPSGCSFHPRCPYVQDICKEVKPELKPGKSDETHLVRCHFAQELDLRGVD